MAISLYVGGASSKADSGGFNFGIQSGMRNLVDWPDDNPFRKKYSHHELRSNVGRLLVALLNRS